MAAPNKGWVVPTLTAASAVNLCNWPEDVSDVKDASSSAFKRCRDKSIRRNRLMLFVATARKQIVHLVDHQHFEVHVPKMAEPTDLKFGHGMATPHRCPDRRQDVLIEPSLVRRWRRLNQQDGCFCDAKFSVVLRGICQSRQWEPFG